MREHFTDTLYHTECIYFIFNGGYYCIGYIVDRGIYYYKKKSNGKWYFHTSFLKYEIVELDADADLKIRGILSGGDV